MMECPNCNGNARPVRKTVPSGINFTVHRNYTCTSCKFQFKTSEKILFTTLPVSVREKYNEFGRVK